VSQSTISTFDLVQMFPDQESARLYFEAQRWPDGTTCPDCGEAARIGTRKDGFYRCNACLTDFTVRRNTIFERSKVPLHKWLYAMYLLVTARKGISSLQLAKQIGVTQKTAWFMLQRLREACGNDPTQLAGIVENVTERVFAYRPNGDPKPLPKTAQPCAQCGAKAGYACSPDCPEPR
jgi:transposase-like protein